jgi:hypothetical protein
VSVRIASMRLASILGAAIGLVVACTAAQLDAIDPVTYVDGITCPDANGVQQPLIAGYQCCADHGLGPGQCQEGYSCMLPDSCTATPLPPNDAYGARRVTKRRGLR